MRFRLLVSVFKLTVLGFVALYLLSHIFMSNFFFVQNFGVIVVKKCDAIQCDFGTVIFCCICDPINNNKYN